MTAFDRAWGVVKDYYFGDKDPLGIDTATHGSTQGLPNKWKGLGVQGRGVSKVIGDSKTGEKRGWFGTNLSSLGQDAKSRNIPADQQEDFFIDNIGEIETHEATHIAQKPMLRDAANEEREKRIGEAEQRGVKVFRDNPKDIEYKIDEPHTGKGPYYRSDKERSLRPSLKDRLTGKETARESDFDVSHGQMSEWDETGAFTTMYGTSKKNWDGGPASTYGVNGYSPDMTDSERMEEHFKRGYQQIGEDRKLRGSQNDSV
jgi:hypothetical protein